MKRISIIFSGDYDFQVLEIVNGNLSKAWDIANFKFGNPDSQHYGSIDHYDVIEFVDIDEANRWILQQVKNGRKKLN